MSALSHRAHATPEAGRDPAAGAGGAAQAFAQPYGNAAAAAGLGLDVPAADWSPTELAGWAFGRGEEAQDGPPAQPGASEGAGGLPRALVDWVDAHLPVGIGIAGSVELALKLGLFMETPVSISVVNQGGGWLEVEVSGGLGFGAGLGLGAVAGDTGAEAEVTGGVAMTGARTFRVPWTRLASATTLARLAGSAILGEVVGGLVEALAPEDLLAQLIGGHDLTPFLVSERLEGTGHMGAGAGGGALGEELEAALTDTVGLAISVEYEDLADEAGVREGEVKLEGSAELLAEAAIDLSKTIGVDTNLVLPHIRGTCALVLPFTETDGDKRFAAPYVEVSVLLAAGPVGVQGAVALGPAHAGVSLEVELDPGSLLWQRVLDDAVGRWLEMVTLGLAEVETSGSMTLGLEVELDHPLLPAAAEIAGDVASWIATGAATDALAPHVDLIERLVDAAELTLGVDLVVLALRADGGLEVAEGLQAGVEGEAELALIYQRDDLLEDLRPAPTVPEAVSYVRTAYGGVR
jgi:hypothetical protein